MLCPNCKIEAVISGTETRVRGDESPDTRTEVTLVQFFVCRNPRCSQYGKTVCSAEHRLVG